MLALEFVVGYNFSVPQSLTIADLINANKPKYFGTPVSREIIAFLPNKKGAGSHVSYMKNYHKVTNRCVTCNTCVN